MPRYVIIGNGAAGLSAAEIIRRRDPQGQITLLTKEPHLFYSRPGIAYVLNGQVPPQQIIARTRDFYREHRLDLQQATVTDIDAGRQVVRLHDGAQLAYDALLLATGSSAVKPPFPGGELDGVVTFDTLDDATNIIARCRARRARTAVVVGGGITAMELAEGMQRQGVQVHLLQRGQRIWPRLLQAGEAEIVARHAAHEGVRLQYGEEVTEILGHNGRVSGVRLQSGGVIDCQMVGVAIGVRPNLQLVQALSVARDKGLLVNEHMQTTIPTLFAAGDVAQVYDRWSGAPQLDVLWPSAINEGRAAGYNMAALARGSGAFLRYEKGSPFNAALLFGVHLTVSGHLGNSAGDDVDEEAAVAAMSRGSSQTWTAPFRSAYRSAWDRSGDNALRLTLVEGRIRGALLLGDQTLADALRYLVSHQVDVSHVQEQLLNAAGPQLSRLIWELARAAT